MSADALSAQQPQVMLKPAGGSSVSPKSKLHVPPWPQSIPSEALKNGHEQTPASLSKSQVDIRPPVTRGHKRSATGEIKSARHDNQSQTLSNGLSGHLRTASLDSTGNKIAEVRIQSKLISVASFADFIFLSFLPNFELVCHTRLLR